MKQDMDCKYCGKENKEQKCVIFGRPDRKDPAYGFSIGGDPKLGIKAGTMCCSECWDKRIAASGIQSQIGGIQ